MTRRFLAVMAIWLLVGGFAHAAEPGAVPEGKKESVKDDPNLPRVLIIGDSISIGYTPDVIEMLKGKINVHHNAGNGGPTSNGIKNIDAWLGEGKWDVIHFNFGLHDLKTSSGGKGDQPYPEGHQVTPEQYEKNLREMIAKMKKTGAKLIWATTTPVPEAKQSPGRVKGDEVLYNNVAKKVMDETGVETDDLYALVLPRIEELQLKKNVHFNKEGYKVLATQVVTSIEKALSGR